MNPPDNQPAPGEGGVAARVENHPWPDCKEVQCKQVHECLNSIMEMLGVQCDDNIYVVGKAVRISEAIQSLKHQLDAAVQRAEELEKAFQPCLDKITENFNRQTDAWVKERDELREKLAECERERDTLKFKWDAETCQRCGYMRSPVAPCKCGQLVVIGTNDRLRAENAGLREAASNAIEAYSLITGWHGVECDCGHPACKRCKDTKAAQELIRAAQRALQGGGGGG